MNLDGLIVGLGNPGGQYQGTRHNFGFMVLEALLEACVRQGEARKLSGQKDPFNLWRAVFPGRSGGSWLLAEPLAFMNRSGEAVQRIAAYYHVEHERILVLHDELDLPLGRMKLKKGGGSAGHNGIRSIEQMLGTPDFFRLRLGVGKPPGHDGASWVLGRFRDEEKALLNKVIEGAVQGVLLFTENGERTAQQFCNGFSTDPV